MEQRFLSFDVEGMNHVDQLVASLLNSALSNLNDKAEGRADLYHKMKPSEVEQLSYISMVEVAPSVGFPKERIELISGHVFPDILLHNTRYGVEIKSTQKDAWTSVGSSIIESTRDKDTERIYMLFADIAFKFASWVSVEFELYLIKEFQRLKEEEQKQIGWSAKRELSKINYRIHTDAIKANLIPSEVTREQAAMKYADEADVLNIAMFGMTARQWREQNPDKKGNIRDYASINELICLSNMENLNAMFINDGMPQSERLIKLNQIAIQQMRILEDTGGRNLLQ